MSPSRNWQLSIAVGDRLLKNPGTGILVYQKVLRMTRSPKQYRLVEGFSCMVPTGEQGDTSIWDTVGLISEGLWKYLEDAGFPATISIPTRWDVVERDGTRFPILNIDTLSVN